MDVRQLMAKAALSLVAVGSLVTVGAGMAGATSAPAPQGTQAVTAATLHASAEHAASCSRRTLRTAAITRREKRFAAETAALARREAAATTAGRTKAAAYWAKVIARRNSVGGPLFAKRLAAVGHATALRQSTDRTCS